MLLDLKTIPQKLIYHAAIKYFYCCDLFDYLKSLKNIRIFLKESNYLLNLKKLINIKKFVYLLPTAKNYQPLLSCTSNL